MHETLDLVGFVPILGDVADLAHATLYLIEGQWGKASYTAALVFVPNGFDWLGRNIKQVGIFTKFSGNVIDMFQLYCVIGNVPSLVQNDLQAPSCKWKKLGPNFSKVIDKLKEAKAGWLKNFINHGGDVAKKVFNWLSENTGQYDNLAATWDKAFDVLDDTQREVLLLDLATEGSEGLIEAMGKDPELVDAWKILYTARNSGGLKRAIEVLTVVKRLIKDPVFIENVGGEAAFLKILKNYAGSCSSCRDGVSNVVTSLRPVDEMLIDLEYFVNNFNHLPNSDQLIRALGSDDVLRQHSPSFIMSFFRKTGIEADDVEKFEDALEGFVADIKLLNGDRIELKSWQFSSISNLANLPINSQLVGYIGALPKAEYWYDFNRLKDEFSSIQEAENAIRKIYQKLFSQNADQIYRSNPAFFSISWKGTNIENPQTFLAFLVNDEDFYLCSIFDFIKVK